MPDISRPHSPARPVPAVDGWHPSERRSRLLAVVLPALILLVGLTWLLLPQSEAKPTGGYAVTSAPAGFSARTSVQLPESISTALPDGTAVCTVTFTREKLLAGKLLLIDAHHPIPENAAPPNTFGVLLWSHGSLTCRDVTAVLGDETLSALTELFAQARWEHVGNLMVYRGTLSQSQQRLRQTERFTLLSASMPLQDALDQTLKEIADPGCSEHQQGFSVDLRLCDGWDQLPSTEPLTATTQGQWLIDNCWRFGFIWRWDAAHPSPDPEEQWHFRYVGKAHAALIHALGVTLEDYLALLHRSGTLVLLGETGRPLFAALCRETSGDLTLPIPTGAHLDDVSLDSLGWAAASFVWDDAP